MTKKPYTHTHTPGPWTIDGDSLVMGGQVVAHAADLSTDSSSYEEGIANLRLVAAAPELLGLDLLAKGFTPAEIDRLGDRAMADSRVGGAQ